ncbi:uncharacterized protein LOC124856096 isoform X2 [Girardinichthys multiradiatus]|uniref:uncharacterized protein LOC124856096 isoform X2 n=1 Tax=Girardinichthys multiradiatus TaxID=208333 RepID=UPI001FAD80E3|nr:uncharacterized protein LOC124856096 isoform X2 [Girardinichthys multiradiatus]
MAKSVFFVILICSIHGFGTKDFPPPKLTASRSVIIETDSVTLNCEGLRSSDSKCSFYTQTGRTLHDLLCNQTLTGTELLQMEKLSSPAQAELSCCPTIQPGTTCSVFSEILSINIQRLPPPKVTVSSAMITDTDSVTLTCVAPSPVSVSACYFYILVQSKGFERHSSCHQSLTGTELLEMENPRLPAEVKVNCRYTAEPGQVYSPHGNLTSIFIQNKMEMKTDLTTTLIPSQTSAEVKSNTDKVFDMTSLSALPPPKVTLTSIFIQNKMEMKTDLTTTLIPSKISAEVKSNTDKVSDATSLSGRTNVQEEETRSPWISDELKDTRQPGEVLIQNIPAGAHQPYMITSGCFPADFQVQNMQENENDDPDNFYHTYSTIPD